MAYPQPLRRLGNRGCAKVGRQAPQAVRRMLHIRKIRLPNAVGDAHHEDRRVFHVDLHQLDQQPPIAAQTSQSPCEIAESLLR